MGGADNNPAIMTTKPPVSPHSHEQDTSNGATRPSSGNHAAFSQNELAHPTPQSANITVPTFVHHVRRPSSQGLSLQTELANRLSVAPGEVRGGSQRSSMDSSRGVETHLQPSPTYPRRASLNGRRSLDDWNTFSPPSSASSPALGPLNDVTPLPSPIYRSNSPELWRRIVGRRRGSSEIGRAHV